MSVEILEPRQQAAKAQKQQTQKDAREDDGGGSEIAGHSLLPQKIR